MSESNIWYSDTGDWGTYLNERLRERPTGERIVAEDEEQWQSDMYRRTIEEQY